MQRTCTHCNLTKNLEDFGTSKKGKLGYRHQCKACLNIVQRTRLSYSKNKAYRATRYKNDPLFKTKYLLNKIFGMSMEDYDTLLKAQKGKCAICLSEDTGSRLNYAGTRRFSVDHCHDTGVVRGLLCANCNNGLGRFKDNPVSLARAITYLAESRTPFTHTGRSA